MAFGDPKSDLYCLSPVFSQASFSWEDGIDIVCRAPFSARSWQYQLFAAYPHVEGSNALRLFHFSLSAANSAGFLLSRSRRSPKIESVVVILICLLGKKSRVLWTTLIADKAKRLVYHSKCCASPWFLRVAFGISLQVGELLLRSKLH